MLLILLSEASQTLVRAENALKSKNYEEAIDLFNLESQTMPLSTTSFFFRATSFEALGEVESALEDYFTVSEKSSQHSTLETKANERIFSICESHCYLNCVKTYGDAYFNKSAIKELNELHYIRETILRQEPDIDDLKELNEKCSRDPAIKLALLNAYIVSQDFESAYDLAESFRVTFVKHMEESQMISDILQLISLFKKHSFDELEQRAKQFSEEEPDELIYTHFYKLGNAVKKFKQDVSSLTTENEEGLEQISQSMSKVRTIPTRLIKNIEEKLEFILEEIAHNDRIKIAPDAFDFIDEEIDEIYEVANKMTEKHAFEEETLEDMEQESPELKYLKALFYYNNIQYIVEKISNLEATSDDFVLEAETADKELNFAYTLLKQCYTLDKQSFEQMKVVVSDFNNLADKVFRLYIKSLLPDPYKVLGISQKSSDDFVRKTYFRLARTLHPDMVPKNATEEEKDEMARKFEEVAEAYDTLSDPKKKEEYLSGELNMEKIENLEEYHIKRKQSANFMLTGEEVPNYGGEEFYYYEE